MEDGERIFTELIRSIERCHSEVTQLIRDQERVLVSQAEGLFERLRQEIDNLKRRDAELEQFSHTAHIHFLQVTRSEKNGALVLVRYLNHCNIFMNII